MAQYQDVKTYESGFYNNIVVNGLDTRVYSAEKMCEPYSSIFSDGVKPNADGVLGSDLQVDFVNGMTIKINPGYGLFGGRYFRNHADYKIILDKPTTTARYDCIVIASNRTEEVNETTIYVKSLNHVPTKDDLVRNDVIKEFIIAYVVVQGETQEISQGVIYDTRLNQDLCGVITGVYNQLDGKEIYKQWQYTFDTWLNEAKMSYKGNTTLIRYYASQYVTTAVNEKVIPINISQFNMTTDSILVYVNGLVLDPQTGYEVLSNEEVELSLALPVVGTKVQIEVFKSVDGAQSESVVNEVRVIQDQVARLESFATLDYYCNGVNDNEKISEIALSYLQKDTSNRTATIRVFGTVGINTPTDGVFFKLGTDTKYNRRVIVDFGNTNAITLNCEAGKNYTAFEGERVHIKNCDLICNCTYADSTIKVFSSTCGAVRMDDCRIWINGNNNCYVSENGTFNNCRVSVSNTALSSMCFNAKGLLRLNGGEYYSYTGNSSSSAAVVFVNASATDAVVITYGISCPTSARGGYKQEYAINCNSNNGKCSFTDTITTLSITATGQNIRGTIAADYVAII